MNHNFWKFLKILKVPFSKAEFHCKFNIFFWKSKFLRVDFPQFCLKFVFEFSLKFHAAKKKIFSEFIFDKNFQQFWFFGFLRYKVWNEPFQNFLAFSTRIRFRRDCEVVYRGDELMIMSILSSIASTCGTRLSQSVFIKS